MWVSESAIKEPFWAQICIIVNTFFEGYGGICPPNPQYNIRGPSPPHHLLKSD